MHVETVHLRFADQQEAIRALVAAGVSCPLNGDGTLKLPCDGVAEGVPFALNLLFGTGTLQHQTIETGSFEGEAIALTAPTPGFHLNLCWHGPLPQGLRPYAV
ncbi:hypothetical protein ABID21_000488 [Pseudorhizobium tarimense]|uniref:Uncharacterized protein n=1 Tax=Pseudorhizobium tarimense TaxID=1079109 RepID=A0ABV2H1G9_9HYPH|nr:hypothetical protein [Pseudorhizobium tarimense]MCJ8517981.1 hypothetical protein [Pseudorhizobium tarimense]